jgi:filamentous hemagglutinin
VDSNAYRESQAELIANGKLRKAIQMDIDDIRAKFGTKYDANIQQMLDEFVGEF